MSRDEERAFYDKQFERERRWKAQMVRGLSLGHLTADQAKDLGYHASGHATESGTGRSLWQPMTGTHYHVTTDLAGVRAHGLKTREELEQTRGGLGLGGGEDNTISTTTSRPLAEGLLGALHEFHNVVTGKLTPQQLWDQAGRGTGASRPFQADIAHYWDRDWKKGDPLPDGLRRVIEGTQRWNTMGTSQRQMDEMHPEYNARPAKDDKGWMSGHTPPQKMHAWWERDLSPDERRENAADFYKTFSTFREGAGGPPDPLFFSTDTKAFAAKDPANFALLTVKPKPGAQGYPLSGMNEWRTGAGRALEVTKAETGKPGEPLVAATSPVGGWATAGSPDVQALSEALHTFIGSFDPGHMADLEQFLQDLPGAIGVGGTDFLALAGRLASEHPVDAMVCERLREAAAALGGLEAYFSDLYGTWRSVHARDLARLEDPRPAEHKWDAGVVL